MPLNSQEAQEIYTSLGALRAKVEALTVGVGRIQASDKDFTAQLMVLNNFTEQLQSQLQAVPPEIVKRNHLFISALIEQQEAKTKFWVGLQEKIATAGILRVSLLLATGLWAGGSEWVANFWRHITS